MDSNELDELANALGYPGFQGISGLDMSRGIESYFKRDADRDNLVAVLSRVSPKAEAMSNKEIIDLLIDSDDELYMKTKKEDEVKEEKVVEED